MLYKALEVWLLLNSQLFLHTPLFLRFHALSLFRLLSFPSAHQALTSTDVLHALGLPGALVPEVGLRRLLRIQGSSPMCPSQGSLSWLCPRRPFVLLFCFIILMKLITILNSNFTLTSEIFCCLHQNVLTVFLSLCSSLVSNSVPRCEFIIVWKFRIFNQFWEFFSFLI